uniref:Uncharacterized protein n=2 Tax=Emiliania huxleyi TaxID=2903 RepID=A0A0D3IZL1_EMIH1
RLCSTAGPGVRGRVPGSERRRIDHAARPVCVRCVSALTLPGGTADRAGGGHVWGRRAHHRVGSAERWGRPRRARR